MNKLGNKIVIVHMDVYRFKVPGMFHGVFFFPHQYLSRIPQMTRDSLGIY